MRHPADDAADPACVRCGAVLHTGEARVVVPFTLNELEELACAAPDPSVRRRLLCAIGLMDEEREQRVRELLQAAGL